MRLLEIPNQEEVILTLERASYEVSCRQNIINFMVRDGMIETDNFKKYWNEYILYTKAYDQLKYEFQDTYISKDFSGNWEIDFNTKEIKLYD